MTDDLLAAVVAKLDRGSCPGSKWPDKTGDYWPLSPFRTDKHSGSFSVGPLGWYDFATGEGGSLHDLARKLGVEPEVLQGCTPAGKEHRELFSLEVLAQAKCLPIAYLRELGLSDRRHQGAPVVRIPYLDQAGQLVVVHYRFALYGPDRFRWGSGSAGKIVPYGLWRLGQVPAGETIYIVEGETDAIALWLHNLCALGIPGATMWKDEFSTYVAGHPVCIWQEPGQAAASFVGEVGRSLPDAIIMHAPPGVKDICDAHRLGYDLPEFLQGLRSQARSFSDMRADQLSEQALKARQDAAALLTSPDILGEFVALCSDLGLVGEERIAKLLYLAITSRLLPKPVSMAVKGPSSGGKSYAVETVLRAFPGTAYYALSSFSEHALAYGEEPLKHRVLVLYEAAGLASDFASYLLRSLLSEGRVRYLTVEKGEGGLEARLIEREGPTGLVVTTTAAVLHPENETRILSVTVRDDPTQTQAVLAAMAERANGQGAAEPDLATWHALQLWLELAGERQVTIPYARQLAQLTKPVAVRLRRDFASVLGLVAAHALLYQAQRQRDAEGRIEATVDDYRAVHALVADVINEGARATVSATVRETVGAVAKLSADGRTSVSVAQVARHLHLLKFDQSAREGQH